MRWLNTLPGHSYTDEGMEEIGTGAKTTTIDNSNKDGRKDTVDNDNSDVKIEDSSVAMAGKDIKDDAVDNNDSDDKTCKGGKDATVVRDSTEVMPMEQTT